MRFRIRYADKLVGIFVIVAALFLVVGIVLLGSNQRWFVKDISFVTRFQSAAGASPGTAIMMRGFQVGKVSKVTLNANNEVDGQIVIYREYYPKVKENSILELVTSPIGLGTQLLFHPGKSDTLAAPGSFFPLADSEQGKDLIDQGLVDMPAKDDTITRLISNINPLVDNASKTIVTINRTLTEINRAIAGQSSGPLGSIVTDASHAVSSADVMVANLSRQSKDLLATVDAVAKNLEQTSEAIRDPTGLVPRLLDAKGSVKTILDDDNKLYDRISGSVAELEKTLKNVQAISDSLSAQMPSIAMTIDEGRAAIKQAQDVLTGLRNNPLLKGGIPARVELQSGSQSMREGDF
jgi:phospholipid/cholesterol/gamma-HCH transport system substrate-binding protein